MSSLKEWIPEEVRGLLMRFRGDLISALGGNLVGIYLFGSIAFPEYVPDAGDIDFYVVLRQPLIEAQKEALNVMHRKLARDFQHGERLDGFYIPASTARKGMSPSNLTGAGDGRIGIGAKDNAWALHRAHFHAGSYIPLHGPPAEEIFPHASWDEVSRELREELASISRQMGQYPTYATLNLCRLLYSFTLRRVAVSKMESGRWAMRELPAMWRPIIRAAIHAYRQKAKKGDVRRLKREVAEFYKYALERIGEGF